MKCSHCGSDMVENTPDDSDIKNSVLDELMGAMDDSMGERLPKEPKKVSISMIAIKPKKKDE